MKKTLARIGSVGAAVLLFAAPSAAQVINCSNCNPPGSATNGFFVPPSRTFIATMNQQLSSGAMVSSITGAAVPAAIGTAVLGLMQGAPGALQTVQDALNQAGAPTTATANLMKAMSRISRGEATLSRAEIRNITRAFNAMIRASSSAFLSSNPPMLLGIHAAILNIVNATSRSSSR